MSKTRKMTMNQCEQYFKLDIQFYSLIEKYLIAHYEKDGEEIINITYSLYKGDDNGQIWCSFFIINKDNSINTEEPTIKYINMFDLMQSIGIW